MVKRSRVTSGGGQQMARFVVYYIGVYLCFYVFMHSFMHFTFSLHAPIANDENRATEERILLKRLNYSMYIASII